MNSKWLDYTTLTLVIVGAVNWGLVGFFKFDLVAYLFGSLSLLSRIIYALVGLSGLYVLSMYGRISCCGRSKQNKTNKGCLSCFEDSLIFRICYYNETITFDFAHSGRSHSFMDTLSTKFTPKVSPILSSFSTVAADVTAFQF